MPAHSTLILTVAASIGIAFLFGLAAARLRLPPIVGYLLAGIAVGPFTPGYVVDSGMISQAAELGVILLMFGVGLHFSLDDLSKVRRVVVPGALLNSAVSAAVGIGLARLWGQSWGAALVLGLSISVASTVVLLKGLEAQDRLDSPEGHIAVGWLVVEDLLMVFVLVLLPAIAPLLGGSGGSGQPPSGLASALGVATLKVLAFAALMVVVGRRAVPWLLSHVAKLGSRELFTLAVLTIALGIGALASEVFGVSFALGAFFAGAVVSESELSKRAATEALPMQDAFAVLFFLSVGILFDPKVVLASPLAILALVTAVVGGKFVSSYLLMRGLKQSKSAALMIGGSLSQIGEFSFMVSGLGFAAGLIDRELQAMIVATALISITLNQPLLAFLRVTADRLEARTADAATSSAAGTPAAVSGSTIAADEDPFDFTALGGHVVVVGHGRVGTTITEALHRDASARYVVIEEQERLVAGMRSHGERAILGDATRADVLHRAGIDHAKLIVVTAPEPIRARRIVEVARELNPRIAVAVRTHSAAEQAFYEELLHAPGARGRAIYAEREAALSLAHYTLAALGRSDDESDLIIDALRNATTRPTEMYQTLPTREYRAILAADPNHVAPRDG